MTFNDHEGSTKSYKYTRKNQEPIVQADFVPPAAEITAEYADGDEIAVPMHDGSIVRFTKVPEGYDPSDRDAVVAYLREHQAAGRIPTGLLFLDPAGSEMQAADALVHPSPYETFGVVLIEALSCGLPVVVASDGGLVVAPSRLGVMELACSGQAADGMQLRRFAFNRVAFNACIAGCTAK